MMPVTRLSHITGPPSSPLHGMVLLLLQIMKSRWSWHAEVSTISIVPVISCSGPEKIDYNFFDLFLSLFFLISSHRSTFQPGQNQKFHIHRRPMANQFPAQSTSHSPRFWASRLFRPPQHCATCHWRCSSDE
jgi:hypothetical protein